MERARPSFFTLRGLILAAVMLAIYTVSLLVIAIVVLEQKELADADD